MARENLTAPLDLTVSQCDCARFWTAGTVKPQTKEQRRSSAFTTTNWDEGEGPNMLNSGVRDSKRRMWSMLVFPD